VTWAFLSCDLGLLSFVLQPPGRDSRRGKDAIHTDSREDEATAEALYQAGLSSSYLANQRAMASQRELVAHQERIADTVAREEAVRRQQLRLPPEPLQKLRHQWSVTPEQQLASGIPEHQPVYDDSSQETLILETKDQRQLRQSY